MLTVKHVIVPGSDSDKNAKKMRTLFIPGPESQVLLQKNWRKLEKIVGCCSDALDHFIISYYAAKYHSTHHSHFLCVHYATLNSGLSVMYYHHTTCHEASLAESYATLRLMYCCQVSLCSALYIKQSHYFHWLYWCKCIDLNHKSK